MSDKNEIEFVNREPELNDLCRRVSLKTVVEAPAGFGKTHLLRKAKEKFLAGVGDGNSVPTDSRGCAHIDLRNYSGKTGCLKLINDIAEEIGKRKLQETDLVRASDELAGHLGTYNSILLMFDSVERSDEDTLRWLYEDYLEGGVYQALSLRLKIVFAGRHLKHLQSHIDRFVKRYLPPWDGYDFVELKPFTERVVEEFLLKRYEKTKGGAPQVSKEMFQSWSSTIMELSGGHPRTITRLADYLSAPGGVSWSRGLTTQGEKERVYQSIIVDEVESVLEGVSDKQTRDDLMVLSVFRIFNLNTIEHLKSLGEFEKSRVALKIFVPLTRTGLVKKYPKSIFYSDSMIRNIVLSKLRNERQEDYTRINKLALEYYDGLIKDALAESLRLKALNKTVIPDFFAEYTSEAIYHLSQMPELSQAMLEERLRKYANSFKEVGLASDDEDCRDQIERIIRSDAEIVSAIGSDLLNRVITRLSTPSASIAQPVEVVSAQPVPSKQLKVLFLAANPIETRRLQLDEEIRSIKDEVRWAQQLQVINIVPEEAVRATDIIRMLNEHTPDIVHFSGHGSQTGEILLVDKAGEGAHPVGASVLRQIFDSTKVKVQMVVFNACYSEQIAKTLVEVVDFAVGTSKAITGHASIAFAAAFYSGLGYRNTIRKAFDQGRAAVHVVDPDHEDVLGLESRAGLDPAGIYLIH
ncbi:MAG TPA: CHAT domain-containing protein [Blastocatellia bacterium]|nr:CHAT domain-containing protein [Blastocatellia bacterium]